jgi:hypothetical protein
MGTAQRRPYKYRDLIALWRAAWRLHRTHRASQLVNARDHRRHQRWLGNRPAWFKPWTLPRWFSLEPEVGRRAAYGNSPRDDLSGSRGDRP